MAELTILPSSATYPWASSKAISVVASPSCMHNGGTLWAYSIYQHANACQQIEELDQQLHTSYNPPIPRQVISNIPEEKMAVSLTSQVGAISYA
jgi:hypothetical protein